MTGHQRRLIGALAILIGTTGALFVNAARQPHPDGGSAPPTVAAAPTPFADDLAAQDAAAVQLLSLATDTTTVNDNPLLTQFETLLGQLAAVCPQDSYATLAAAITVPAEAGIIQGMGTGADIAGLLSDMALDPGVIHAGQVGSCRLALLHWT